MTGEGGQAYDPPVNRLLSIGQPASRRSWSDYPRRYGLTREHVPELVRMVQDIELNLADEDSDEVWAPLHAWRALARLRAEEAVDGILAALHLIDETDDDWILEELPEVLGYIGPAALPAVADYLADERHGEFPHIAAARAVSEIGKRHPEARDRCVALLSEQLAQYSNQPGTINAFLINNLVELEAVEAAPVIEKAFAANRVDLMLMGDWHDVQGELGLLDESTSEESFRQRLRDEGRARREQRATSDKVGRNDPCPCGSGKKYKYCHGRPG